MTTDTTTPLPTPAPLADPSTFTRPAEEAPARLTLSVPEVAAVLGISRALAYELVARGELPSLRLGRRVVVPAARLAELVAGCG